MRARREASLQQRLTLTNVLRDGHVASGLHALVTYGQEVVSNLHGRVRCEYKSAGVVLQ
jgi:hypothetical protein